MMPREGAALEVGVKYCLVRGSGPEVDALVMVMMNVVN